MAVLKLIRQTFFVIIVFQLTVGNTFAASGDGVNNGSNGGSSDLAATATALYSDIGERTNALKMMEAANQLDNGEFFKQDPKNFDIFRLVDQRVEIYENNKVVANFSLNTTRIQKPIISFTNLKPRYNQATKELIFEATRGDRADGTGGTIVARHIIPDLDIVAMAHDRELLTFLDSHGNLHAIHMGQVISQAFTSPILVSRNLWSPKRELNLTPQTVQMDYLTAGVTPFAANADLSEAVIPLNKDGKMQFEAGNILVRIKENGNEKVLGVFSRDVTKQLIQKNIAWAMQLRFLVTPDQEIAKMFVDQEARLNQLTEDKANSMIAAQEFMSPFKGIDINQLQILKAGLDVLGEKDERTDKFTYEEWVARNNKLKETVKDPAKLEAIAKHVQHLQEKAVGDDYKKIYREAYNQFLADAESRAHLANETNLAKSWQVLNDQAPRANPFAGKETKAKAEKKISSDRAGEWKFVGVVMVSIAAYLSGAAVLGNVDALHQFQTLNWIYDHMYFDVLKDVAYRYPLSLSILSWIGVWPAALATSFGFEKVLNAVNNAYKSSNSKLAQFVRDFRKTWGPITDWQRILSVGMRSYSYVVYPYLRVFIENALRQKAFLSAYENGLNPFQKVAKDSELGKMMGLDKNEFLGLNNPIQGKESMAQTVDKKAKLQSALQQQNVKAKSLAWTLASFAIAEKNGIDPATLLQISQRRVTTDQLRTIMSDPAKEREWELLSAEIHKELKARNALSINQEIKNIDPKTIAEFYTMAKDAAEQINAQSEFKQKATLRWKKFKSLPIDAMNFLLLQNGKNDALFLRSIITNRFVSSQVKQEFRNDHLMVVLLTAFIGDRANLAHPESLTADRNGFLFTSHQHNYDMALNTFAHFFVSGASLALVFQKLRAQKETNYLPESDFTQTSEVREEGFLSGLKSWLSFGYDEIPKEDKPTNVLKKGVHYMYNLATKTDLGGVMVKRVKKRMTTIQAGLTMALVLRTMVGGQDVGTALAAWSLMFVAGQWFYGWVWDPVQRGNQMIDERVERHNEELRQARYNIETGLKTGNMDMVKEGYDKMSGLFEKYNGKDVKNLKDTLNSSLDKVLNPNESRVTGNEKEYYGLMAKLAFANKTGNQAEFDQAISSLRQVLVEKQGYDKEDILKLNAQSLLEFSLSNPPVYTHANKFISEFFTWNGAVWSTYLYIPLSIMLYSAHSLSTENILKWTMISTGLYVSSYALFGRTPWLTYEKMYNNLKARFQEKAATKAGEKTPSAAITPTGLSCSRLFN